MPTKGKYSRRLWPRRGKSNNGGPGSLQGSPGHVGVDATQHQPKFENCRPYPQLAFDVELGTNDPSRAEGKDDNGSSHAPERSRIYGRPDVPCTTLVSHGQENCKVRVRALTYVYRPRRSTRTSGSVVIVGNP